MEQTLSGLVAVITGATQGLGECIAREFAARGAAGLVLSGRNRERGEAVARDLAAGGCPTRFVAGDLGELEVARSLVATADQAFGRLHALVNAAALTDRGTILDTEPELFDRMFAINVRAPFFLMQDAARLMRRERIAGTIVSIQSMSGHGGQSFLAAYAASKGALGVLTRNVAYALLPDRIRVNGLNIGWMNTPGEHSIQQRFHDAAPDWLERAVQARPFGRLIDPAEVARMVAFLSSDESGLMTGSNIDYDQMVLGCADDPHLPTTPLPDRGF